MGYSKICLVTAVGVIAKPIATLSAPPMGFMSWERFRCEIDCETHPNDCINENLYKEMADRLVADGYLAVGYNQVSIDDCWAEMNRDPNTNRMVPDAKRFPNGMKALSDYIHNKGLRFGLYGDAGTKTCGGYPGSLGYQKIDAESLDEWGVDYMKLDGCFLDNSQMESAYVAFGDALTNIGREVVYSCSWPAYLPDDEGKKPYSDMYNKAGCNLWRNWSDIENTFDSLKSIIMHWSQWWKVMQSVPKGSFNDPDMIIAGDDHTGKVLPLNEAKIQLTMWSMMAAPLIIGGDLRTIGEEYRTVLQNQQMIAINQDSGIVSGECVTGCGQGEGSSSELTTEQIWTRKLSSGSVALAFLNLSESSVAELTIELDASSYPSLDFSNIECTDVWDSSRICGKNSKQSEDWEIALKEGGGIRISAKNIDAISQRFIYISSAAEQIYFV